MGGGLDYRRNLEGEARRIIELNNLTENRAPVALLRGGAFARGTALPQLFRHIIRHVAGPALSSVECNNSNGIGALSLYQMANESLEIRIFIRLAPSAAKRSPKLIKHQVDILVIL
jgi:hypothetical protein